MESNKSIPFPLKRVYFLSDVPADKSRGAHAHKLLKQVFVALVGSFELILDDGYRQQSFILNNPGEGLVVPAGLWRDLKNFSVGSVCCVFASDYYDEHDYIRNYDEYLRSLKK